MASIPLPALAIKPPEQQDPFGGLQKLEYLRSLSNQQQLQQQEIAKNQQALTDQQAMTKAMKGVDPYFPHVL